jgi:hypothetical protein
MIASDVDRTALLVNIHESATLRLGIVRLNTRRQHHGARIDLEVFAVGDVRGRNIAFTKATRAPPNAPRKPIGNCPVCIKERTFEARAGTYYSCVISFHAVHMRKQQPFASTYESGDVVTPCMLSAFGLVSPSHVHCSACVVLAAASPRRSGNH